MCVCVCVCVCVCLFQAETLDDIETLQLEEYLRNAACLTGEDGCFGFYFDTNSQVLSIVLHDVSDAGKANKRSVLPFRVQARMFFFMAVCVCWIVCAWFSSLCVCLACT
jgi:hypothetical protein